MRIEPYAMCEEERQTGTNRFVHSEDFGIIASYEIG
jgi:hypothetical protein